MGLKSYDMGNIYAILEGNFEVMTMARYLHFYDSEDTHKMLWFSLKL